MRSSQVAGLAVIAVIAALATADGQAKPSATSGRLTAVIPRVGIGPVRLAETKANVRRRLGRGHLLKAGPDRGSYRYRSGSIAILVSYDAGDRVDGVMTHSDKAVLYGRRLADGLARLRPVVRRHGWMILSCHGETFTFVYPGGPGTGIAWRSGRLDEVFVTGGGSVGEQCLPEF